MSLNITRTEDRFAFLIHYRVIDTTAFTVPPSNPTDCRPTSGADERDLDGAHHAPSRYPAVPTYYCSGAQRQLIQSVGPPNLCGHPSPTT